MALTLVEAAKGESDVFKRGVIETFTEGNRLSQVLPIRGISGRLDGVELESVLPEAETRGVNEAFASTKLGRTEEIIQALKIYGGDIGIDPFVLETEGRDKATTQISMKIKAISNRWLTDFFKGDSAANPRDFDGLQLRLSGTNVISAGSSSGGDALALTILDRAIQFCHNPQFLLMGRNMHILLTQAGRDTTVAGTTIRTEKNEFGRQVTMYGDLEVVQIVDNANNDNILGFTEAATGGASTASSVYVVGVGEEGVQGIQNGGFRVRNLGESGGNTVPTEETRVEWYNNFQIEHQRGAIRIRDIDEAAFVS